MPDKPRRKTSVGFCKKSFELGYLTAAADCARNGMDGEAEELMGHCGIRTLSDLRKVRDLETFDRKPLMRVLRLIQ